MPIYISQGRYTAAAIRAMTAKPETAPRRSPKSSPRSEAAFTAGI